MVCVVFIWHEVALSLHIAALLCLLSCLKTPCDILGPHIPIALLVNAQGECVFFFRLMLRCGIKRGRIKDDVELKQLQQFWAFAGDANFSPPLGQQEAAMLQQLGSIR